MTSSPPPKLSVFNLPEVRTFLVAMFSAGAVSMVASAFVSARGSDAVVVERMSTHDRRLTDLEEVTKSIAATQASQAASSASVAATQEAMARVLERLDRDVRDLRVKAERGR